MSNNINIKENVGKIKGGGTAIPVGINEKVDIVQVERGSNYVDVFLKDEWNRTKKDRIFDPSDKYVYPKDGQTRDEAYTDIVNERSKHLLQYVISATDTSLPDTVSGYEDVVRLTVQALQKPTYKVNVKLVPNKNEAAWSEFPRFAPYVERYREGYPATLKFSAFELKAMKPKESTTKDPFTLF
jgi:hypothetical protein